MGLLRQRGPLAFLLFSFSFSYTFWLLSWLVARSERSDVPVNEYLLRGLLFGDGVGGTALTAAVLALVAGYGPLLGGVVATLIDHDMNVASLGRRLLKVRFRTRWYRYAAIILLAAWLVPVVFAYQANGGGIASAVSPHQLAAFLAAVLLFQLFTASLAEVGWRGYLLEKVLQRDGLWEAGWTVGVVWALWHFPIVIIVFIQQGMDWSRLPGSLVGFAIVIVGISILQAWFYVHTRSVLLAMLLYAGFTTLPLTSGVLIGDTSLVPLASQLVLWGAVILIVNREEQALIVRTARKGRL